MSLWDKNGKLPQNLTEIQKRNVIATKQGYVRRLVYTDVHSNVRTKEEILIAIPELDGIEFLGNPKISQIYLANTTGGTVLRAGQVNHAYVAFAEAISIGAGATPLTMAVANTAAAAAVVATANTNKLSITNANNTLDFKFVATAGTYKIQAQTLSNTASALVYSIEGGISETSNNVVTAATSNTLSTFTIV